MSGSIIGLSGSNHVNQTTSESRLPQSKEGVVEGRHILATKDELLIGKESSNIEPRHRLLVAGRHLDSLPTSSEFRKELGIARFSIANLFNKDFRAVTKSLDEFHKMASSAHGGADRMKLQAAFESLLDSVEQLASRKGEPMKSQLSILKDQIIVEHEFMMQTLQTAGEGQEHSPAQLTSMTRMVAMGIPKENALSMAKAGVEPKVALAFKEIGASLAQVLEWGPKIENGDAFVALTKITLKESLLARLAEAPALCKKGAAEVIIKLAQKGAYQNGVPSLGDLSPKVGLRYIEAGLTSLFMIRDVAAKGEYHISVKQVATFVGAGVTTPSVMRTYLSEGVDPSRGFDNFARYAKYDLPPEFASGYRSLENVSDKFLDAARSTEKSQFPPIIPDQIKAAHEAGFSDGQMREFRAFASGPFQLSVQQAKLAFDLHLPLDLAALAVKQLGISIEDAAKVHTEFKGDTRKVLTEQRHELDLQRMGISEEQIRYKDGELGISARVLGKGAVNQVLEMHYKNSTGVFKAEELRGGSVASYGQVLGISAGDGKQSARNIGTKLVNDLLQFSVIGSVDYAVHQGRVGVVMEKAEGVGMRDLGGRDELKDSQVKGQLRQQLVDLQIVDILTAQMDRHYNNIIVNIGEGVVQVSGVDNDGAFGNKIRDVGAYTGELRNGIVEGKLKPPMRDQLPGGTWSRGYPTVMDQRQYDAVMSLKPEALKQEVALHLGNEEAETAAARLQAFQDHLKNGGVKILPLPENSNDPIDDMTSQWANLDLNENGYDNYNTYLCHISSEGIKKL